ncbi:hypothetical protein EDC01DRAFT_626126 [Geopyxis carbonaria]|nr:hypothetical protein EDC01DRAFT_626126 [Geopyxis carbonaria]
MAGLTESILHIAEDASKSEPRSDPNPAADPGPGPEDLPTRPTAVQQYTEFPRASRDPGIMLRPSNGTGLQSNANTSVGKILDYSSLPANINQHENFVMCGGFYLITPFICTMSDVEPVAVENKEAKEAEVSINDMPIKTDWEHYRLNVTS